MTNEELVERIASGEETALESLCLNNIGLIRNRAMRIAQRYGCIHRTTSGTYTEWTSETLSDLESVRTLALIECVRTGGYDSSRAAFSTYVVPFLDGAMRRYLEKNLNTRSISIYDLAVPDDENDVFDYISADPSATPPQQLVYRKILMEYFRDMFLALAKKDRDILGKVYGVFGYRREPLSEIAMYHMMTESAVEKAKGRALEKLRQSYPESRMRVWKAAYRMLEDAARTDWN